MSGRRSQERVDQIREKLDRESKTTKDKLSSTHPGTKKGVLRELYEEAAKIAKKLRVSEALLFGMAVGSDVGLNPDDAQFYSLDPDKMRQEQNHNTEVVERQMSHLVSDLEGTWAGFDEVANKLVEKTPEAHGPQEGKDLENLARAILSVFLRVNASKIRRATKARRNNDFKEVDSYDKWVEEVHSFFEPSQLQALGLKWENFGVTKPVSGQELDHPQLREALKAKTEFSRQEWDRFGITNLRKNHFVKRGDNYFKPAASGSAPLELRRTPADDDIFGWSPQTISDGVKLLHKSFVTHTDKFETLQRFDHLAGEAADVEIYRSQLEVRFSD